MGLGIGKVVDLVINKVVLTRINIVISFFRLSL